jgi:hypothetical protein
MFDSENEIQGFLRCATHDDAVSSFGRDDVKFGTGSILRTRNGKGEMRGFFAALRMTTKTNNGKNDGIDCL